jgi:hypothetical protein
VGRFADPIEITCPGCGKEALHALSGLRALKAECPFCRQLLRDAGEQIIGLEREMQNDAIAMGITWVIEELDSRLKFSAEDRHYSSLNDVVAEVAQVLDDLKVADDHPSAESLVEAAVKQMIPSIDCPPKHLPMVDVFANHIEEMNAYYFRGWKRARKD